MSSAYLSVIPEFNEKIELLGLDHLFEITKTEIINKVTGSRIVFRGIKTGSKIQTASLKSISGLTLWVLDEAEELIDEDLFDDIARSVRKKGIQNQIILVFNPPTKAHWTYNRFFVSKGVKPTTNTTKGNITYIHTTYLDNIENLNKDFIDEAEEVRKNNPEKWDRIYGGAYREKAEGLIITNWKYGKFPENVKPEYGLDFGFSNDNNALAKCYIDHSKKLFYVKGMLYEKGIIPSELGSIVSKITEKNLIVADSASADIIAELEHRGCNITPIKKPKILDRLEILKDYTIIVDPDSKDIVNEFNEYCWDKNYKEGEKPIDDFNHYVDAINYYLIYRQRNRKIKKYGIR